MTSENVKKDLEKLSTPEKKEFLPYFFKTGKGQYGEGDTFLGVVVPDTRKVAKKHKELSFNELEKLVQSEFHECRLCALLILNEKFKKADEEQKKKIVEFYLNHTDYINNWDLVDLSCRDILGVYLLDKPRDILYKLAASELLWDQRIAIVSTYTFIKKNDFTDILALSEILLNHKHDLLHKAIGWMLREVGKRNKNALCGFLDKHHKNMPRTMLRYSIEKFGKEERLYYMKRE